MSDKTLSPQPSRPTVRRLFDPIQWIVVAQNRCDQAAGKEARPELASGALKTLISQHRDDSVLTRDNLSKPFDEI